MAVQPIKKAGIIVAYQARAGGAGPGHTHSFTVRACGGQAQALAAAQRAEVALLATTGARGKHGHHTRPGRANTSGIPGILAAHDGDNLRIRATWHGGSTGYSVEKHGLEGAMALALAARRKHAKARIDLTPAQALQLLQPQLAALARKL